jgi:hypothetical protein
MLRAGAPRLRAAYRFCGGVLALAVIATALIGAPQAGAAGKKSEPEPASGQTAAEIVAKNVAARGGLEAWRKIQTMVWIGHLQSTREQAPGMQFVLEQKRPNKTRFEVQTLNSHTMRIFDGSDGWSTHPGPDGRPEAQPFAPTETRFARGEQAIDAPLIDAKARDSTVTLVGVDELEGRKTYRLDVRRASGEREFVWVDAKSFLDVKVSRITFTASGQPRIVPVFYRKYQDFEGLQMPTSIEIGDPATGATDRMDIEKVTLNVPMADRLFEKPGTQGRRSMPTSSAASGPYRAPPSAVNAEPGPVSR